jgi:hypothetical protein
MSIRSTPFVSVGPHSLSLVWDGSVLLLLQCGTYWYASPWTSCSASCGITGGIQTRTVSCLKMTDDPATATPQPASACSNTRPSTQAVCNQNPCPQYVASSTWSECSNRCNQGISTRNVTCQAYDGRLMDNSFCTSAVMPQVEQVCQNMPCPHWHRSDWGLCSQNW